MDNNVGMKTINTDKTFLLLDTILLLKYFWCIAQELY